MKSTRLSIIILAIVAGLGMSSPALANRDPMGVGDTVAWNAVHGPRIIIGGENLTAAGNTYSDQSNISPTSGTGLTESPQQYADGMNLYQYTRGNPTNNLDPYGGLTVSAIKSNLKVRCGHPVRIRWDFKLDNKAPCDGYIVQQVDVRCDIKNCNGCPDTYPVEPDFSYWEAWYVKKGGDATDTYYAQVVNCTCGHYNQIGTIKFFCKSTTGDLGASRKPNPASGWTVTGKYGRGYCATTAGALPSTGNQPAWWNNKPTEGPAYRWADTYWNCCSRRKYVSVDADPK